jgi:hypothetical protein
MKNLVIQGSIVLRIINDRNVHRALLLKATELCLDFEIKNNTVSMKLQDSIKVAQAKSRKKGVVVKYARNEYEYGRFSTVSLPMLMNQINKSEQFRQLMGLKKTEQVTNMFSTGKLVSVHALSEEERAKLDKTVKQARDITASTVGPKVSAGPSVNAGRGA